MATTFMPGSFTPDHETTRLQFPIARPSFYVPPSPSASSVLSQTVRSRTSSPARPSRKRSRSGVSNTSSATSRAGRGSLPSSASYTYPLEAPSPAPLVNTDYVFAGGLPSSRYAAEDDHIAEFEKDLRPGRFARTISTRSESYFPRTPMTGADHGGKRLRLSTPRGGWGSTVWHYTGGVAGKAINFCWTVAFSGFHAGQGQGYSMDVGTPVVVPGPVDLSSTNDVFDDKYQGSCGTPLPGSFPTEESSDIRQELYDQLPTPTAKSNWVMVEAPDMNKSETSPARKRARPSTANLYSTSKPKSRPMLSRPRMHTRNSASFTSSRASLAGRPTQDTERPQSAGSDRLHQRSRSSVASPRRDSGTCTPKSPDVIKFEKKLHRQSQRQDDSMKRMNQQMQDMIKEAQQALGAKIEVVDDEEDEGYAEGTQASSYGSNWL
jgi:hypothetical protein